MEVIFETAGPVGSFTEDVIVEKEVSSSERFRGGEDSLNVGLSEVSSSERFRGGEDSVDVGLSEGWTLFPLFFNL